MWFFPPFSGAGPDPNARSFNPGKFRQQAVVSQSVLLPESLIWTYVIQMTSALRHIHSAGLACRTLDPTKILIINKTRLLLNCCGIFDVLTFDPTSSNPMAAMAHYQQEDLIALGKMVLGMCLRFDIVLFWLNNSFSISQLLHAIHSWPYNERIFKLRWKLLRRHTAVTWEI